MARTTATYRHFSIIIMDNYLLPVMCIMVYFSFDIPLR